MNDVDDDPAHHNTDTLRQTNKKKTRKIAVDESARTSLAWESCCNDKSPLYSKTHIPSDASSLLHELIVKIS